MKTLHLLEYLRDRDGETLATFGTARLVKYLDGKVELRGGSPADRTDARQWCSLFMHEVAIAPSAAASEFAPKRPLRRAEFLSPAARAIFK